jgi:DNA-binding CsgD family transcriptional regulator
MRHVDVGTTAELRAPSLRPVDAPAPADGDEAAAPDPGALSDLVAASAIEVADRARAALAPLLAHDALVLVAPAADLPVQIAATRELRAQLSAIDWRHALEDGVAAEGSGARLRVTGPDRELEIAGWQATSGGVTAWLVVVSRGRLEIDPAAEDAATLVTMLAAARMRRADEDPPPGTLAFSRAMSWERERVRAELNTTHAATLSGILQTLRSTSSTPPAVAEAIERASRALLDLEALNALHDEADRVPLRERFAATEAKVRAHVPATRLRVLADLVAPEDREISRAIAQAASLVTVAAALRAARVGGGAKLRVLWRLSSAMLTVTVADNGSGMPDAEAAALVTELEQRIDGLGAELELDTRPHWGTTLRCRLPLHGSVTAPETTAVKRLAELRDREREVLELMIAGLRNRDIAERLGISVRTVKFHVSNVLRKLDVDSRTAAIALAHAAGITAGAAGVAPEREPEDESEPASQASRATRA